MTAFAISSGGIEYYDQKTGGSTNATLDTYTISNGSTLVVRTDSYACANHSAAFGSVDNVTFSGVGGVFQFDPTYVRVIAYTGGSGNSPAYGAAISKGGVSGVFLGVWADWQSDPITPGAAIPASGFIKVGGVSGGVFSSGALTGITATCSGADRQGWIEIRSAETATITVPRIGKVSSTEAWFYLDDTTGVAGQTIPCPTTGTVAQVWAGVWIETAPGSNIYERYMGAGAQVPLSSTPTDSRAKLVWQTTAGLRLGSDGTNNVGYLPPSGCKVRIPATILTNCIRTSGSGSGPRVVPNATLATRAEFNTTSAGDINISTVAVQWTINLSQAFYVKIKSCVVSDNLWLAKLGSATDVDDLIVGPTQSQAGNIALVVTQSPLGGVVKNCSLARFSLVGAVYVSTLSLSKNFTFEKVVSLSLTARSSNGSTGLLVSQSTNSAINDCTCIGAGLGVQTCVNTRISNLLYADGLVATASTNAISAVAISAGSVDTLVDGVATLPGVFNIHPYTAFVSSSNSSRIKIRKIGTYAQPVDAGSANACGLGISLSGNDDVEIKRVYFSNLRTRYIAMTNSDLGVVIQNGAGDYSDASFVQSLNTSVASFGSAGITTGQSAVYGAHWVSHFTSTTQGLFEVLCNEPTAATLSQCAITSGTPIFNASGSVLMTVVGQQIVWEMPYFMLGHTALANSALTLAGTNTSNLGYEFQYDIGSGYNGTWLTANGTNFNAVGAIDPAVGIKIKIRVTCTTANASNVLTNIRITTVTTSSAQSTNLYPLDIVTLSFTGLVAGSDVVVRSAGTGTILASVDSNAGSSWGYVYETPVAIDVDVIKPGYVPKSLLRNYTPSSQNSSLPVSQQIDRNYL